MPVLTCDPISYSATELEGAIMQLKGGKAVPLHGEVFSAAFVGDSVLA